MSSDAVYARVQAAVDKMRDEAAELRKRALTLTPIYKIEANAEALGLLRAARIVDKMIFTGEQEAE